MKKIEIKTEDKYLYTGTFDLSEENIIVSFFANEKIDFNLKTAVGFSETIKNNINNISLEDLKFICKESKIEATIFPSGNIHCYKQDSSNDELKTCYLSFISTQNNSYIICIAFDEIQPMIYKAQLVSCFIIDKICNF